MTSRLTVAFAVLLALFALPTAEAEAQDTARPLFDREAPPSVVFGSHADFSGLRSGVCRRKESVRLGDSLL